MTSVRRFLWNVGAPARLLLVAAIRTYQLTLSRWLGGQCRFFPTCSRYAEEAIRIARSDERRAPRNTTRVALQPIRSWRAGPGASATFAEPV